MTENLDKIAEAHGLELRPRVGNCHKVRRDGEPLGILLHLGGGEWTSIHRAEREPGPRGDFQFNIERLAGK